MFHKRFRDLVFIAVAVVTLVALVMPASASTLVSISGTSPYPDGGDPNDPASVMACNGGPQPGVLYRNSETEPYIAVNPTNPSNMITAWHQDRWSTGSAQGVGCAYTMDGGATWTWVNVPFTRCSGANPGDPVYFERASDPWISFGPDGAAYYMALVSDQTTSRNGMAVAKSTDGGQTWMQPAMIAIHKAQSPNARSLFHDKNTITADPYDPNVVYATWTLFRNNSYALLVSRSTDGGHTWSPALPVNKYEHTADGQAVAQFRQGAQIVVLPDGTVLNAFWRLLIDPRKHPKDDFGGYRGVEQAIFRSHDQGKHWERLDTPVSPYVQTGGFDFELGIFVRDAGGAPDIAVDRHNGYVYMVWQDGRFNEFGASTIVISRSTDGGDTWSEAMPVTDTSNPFTQEFLPAVSVSESGVVGVLYYDSRNDMLGDATFDLDVYMVMLDPDLNIVGEERVTPQSFDLRQMLLTGDRGYFPGDYVGLDAAGDDFVAAITVSNALGLPVEFPQDNSYPQVDTHNRQDIVFARIATTSLNVGQAVDTPRDPYNRDAPAPKSYRLGDAEPNPFNPATVIRFELAEAGPVRLDIFDVSGRLVRSLARGETFASGVNELVWDGTNQRGQAAASGVYFYRMRAGEFVQTKRMILMK